MTPLEELIEKIKKLKFIKQNSGFYPYGMKDPNTLKTVTVINRFQAISTIKTFMKGYTIIKIEDLDLQDKIIKLLEKKKMYISELAEKLNIRPSEVKRLIWNMEGVVGDRAELVSEIVKLKRIIAKLKRHMPNPRAGTATPKTCKIIRKIGRKEGARIEREKWEKKLKDYKLVKKGLDIETMVMNTDCRMCRDVNKLIKQLKSLGGGE